MRWYLDSGCSRHMTGDNSLFTSLSRKEGGTVTFGDNGKGKIVGIGTIGKSPQPTIENVALVDGLHHNLLSVSQLCKIGYKIEFEHNHCLISQNNQVLFQGKCKNNMYTIYFGRGSSNLKCLVALKDDSWLCHKRLGHVNLKLISKLSNKGLVRGLPKIKFEIDRLCKACQFGKQHKSSFKPKDAISTNKPLELIHLDPPRTQVLEEDVIAL